VQKKTKKRLLIILIITASIIVLVLAGSYLAVNYIFSKVTDSVSVVISGEEVNLPVLDANQQVVEGESVNVVLDENAIKELESKVPISEKMEVLALLAKTLSPEDYSVLLSYAVGGVNNEKFDAAYKLLKERLGPEEKAIIKGYYTKYIHLLENN
jgi:ABC-type Na+ efflux pump permease subunit